MNRIICKGHHQCNTQCLGRESGFSNSSKPKISIYHQRQVNYHQIAKEFVRESVREGPSNSISDGGLSWLGIEAKIISSHQQLKTNLDWDVHVWNVVLVAVLVPIVKILDYFFQHHTSEKSAC